MSWSVAAIGKPEAVKRSLAAQFERAKESTASFPHECEVVGAVEKIVNSQLDFVTGVPGLVIQVMATGNAYQSPDTPQKSSAVTLEVKPIYGFVE